MFIAHVRAVVCDDVQEPHVCCAEKANSILRSDKDSYAFVHKQVYKRKYICLSEEIKRKKNRNSLGGRSLVLSAVADGGGGGVAHRSASSQKYANDRVGRVKDLP